jgi:carbonic anhydrase/acetyltransferase-like protein (isoleucine patch superfamily)
MALYRFKNRVPTVGKGAWVSDSARVIGDVVIGEDCYVGHGAILHCNRIDDYAVVGMGAVLSFDVEVGRWAVVAEGCVVPSGMKIPAEKIATGVPAGLTGDVQKRHKDFWSYGKQLYVDLAHKYPKEFERID